MRAKVKIFMNLKLVSCLLTGALFFNAFSQVGINTDKPDSSAILHIKSQDKGLLIPVNDDQDKIYTPTAEGIMFYHVDSNTVFIYDGEHWNRFIKADVYENVNIIGTVSAENYRLRGDSMIINRKVFIEKNDLTVDGALTISNKLIAKDAVIARKSLNVNGPIQADNTLNVNGALTVNNTISAPNYSLNVTGNGPVPRGGIIMWSGINIPSGWALCDGLYHNPSNPSQTSVTQVTGYVKTPDLSGRFVVGYSSSNSDYNNPGNISENGINEGNRYGFDAITLGIENMPAHNHGGGQHSHNVTYVTSTSQSCPVDVNKIHVEVHSGNAECGVTEYSSVVNNAVNVVQNQGGGNSFDNRPKYYALAYIMKL